MDILSRPARGPALLRGTALLKDVDANAYNLFKRIFGARLTLESGSRVPRHVMQEEWVKYSEALDASSRDNIVADAMIFCDELREDIKGLQQSKRNAEPGSGRAEVGKDKPLRGEQSRRSSATSDSEDFYSYAGTKESPGSKHDQDEGSSDEDNRMKRHSVTSAMDLSDAKLRELFNTSVLQGNAGSKDKASQHGNLTLPFAISMKLMLKETHKSAGMALQAAFPDTLGHLPKNKLKDYIEKHDLCPGENRSPEDQKVYVLVGKVINIVESLRSDTATFAQLAHYVEQGQGTWDEVQRIMHNRATRHLGIALGDKQWMAEVKEAKSHSSDKGKPSGSSSQYAGRQGRESRGGGRGGWSGGYRSGGYQYADRDSRDGGYRGRGHRDCDYDDRRGSREQRHSSRGRKDGGS